MICVEVVIQARPKSSSKRSDAADKQELEDLFSAVEAIGSTPSSRRKGGAAAEADLDRGILSQIACCTV